MIVLSGPWLSDHFVKTVAGNDWPLVDAGGGAEWLQGSGARVMDPADALRYYRDVPGCRLLTSGEQALEWVEEYLAGTDAARGARLFKDKTEFRRMLQPVFPELRFHEIPLARVAGYSPEPDFYPFVVKPAVGFFSIGVHTVRSPEEWQRVRVEIHSEISAARRHFPEHMLSQERLLLESYVEGDEFAVDAYFNGKGEAVVLNILEHRFASPQDVSDRLYVTSKAIIEAIGPLAQSFLETINQSCGLKGFPLHAEFRRTGNGRLVPIEINPMRFGGWCTTGDLAHHAWGFNTYELYMQDSKPDWKTVFPGREHSEFGLIVLENSTGIPGESIARFDYQGLLSVFSKPLHLSEMNFRVFPLFGILFAEVGPGQQEEFHRILRSDLGEWATSASDQ